MRTCCSSASSARTCSPANEGRCTIRTPWARAVGSISRATADSVACRSTMSTLPDLTARHAEEVLRDRSGSAGSVRGAIDAHCSDMRPAVSGGIAAIRIAQDALDAREHRCRAACSARARSRTRAFPATPVDGIPTAVPPPRGDRRCRATPRPPAAPAPSSLTIGEACTSSQRIVPSGIDRSHDPHLPLLVRPDS